MLSNGRSVRQKQFIIYLNLFIFLALAPLSAENTDRELSVLSYNVQNIFDEHHDGSEYREFIPGDTWTKKLYEHRLLQLSQLIQGIQADIIALQEIEHAGVLEDLATRYLNDYPYYAASSGDSAVQVGLLSRWPLRSMRQHALQYEIQLRNILEISMLYNGEPMYIFVNHWKSRRGGAAETEVYRRMQAKLLYRAITDILDADPQSRIIALGDFNESPDEYLRINQQYPTAFLPMQMEEPAPYGMALRLSGKIDNVGMHDAGYVFYSPWLDRRFQQMDPPGSYYYRDAWEAIDGILLTESLASFLTDFVVLSDTSRPKGLLRWDGKPYAWQTWREEGYSDHLPLYAVFVIP